MAAHPILTFHDGKLEVPEEVQRKLKLHEGSQLRVVAVSQESVTLQAEPAEPKPRIIGDWRRLEGLLADSPADPNAELEREKQRELAEEARWANS